MDFAPVWDQLAHSLSELPRSGLLLRAAGWGVVREWTDAEEKFAILLAEAEAPRFAP